MVQSRKRSSDQEDTGSEKKRSLLGKPVLKFLVPNHVAGKLIGKGGSAIENLQSSHNLSIKISPNNEFYPGTSDRIVCGVGEIGNIIEFGNYMIGELDKDNDTSSCELKLLISNEAAGNILGKEGVQIKSIKESSGAKIFLDKKGENLTGERVMKILGEDAKIASAFNLIMESVADLNDKISTNNLTYPGHKKAFLNNAVDSGVANLPASGFGIDMQTPFQANYQPRTSYKVKFSAEMEVPDAHVGLVLGKGGETSLKIFRSSGAKLQFSKKDDLIEGTTNRLLTITGDGAQQVQNAYIMVDQILSQVQSSER